eukprot:5076630-Pleurochrysis_carterae.AAC.1
MVEPDRSCGESYSSLVPRARRRLRGRLEKLCIKRSSSTGTPESMRSGAAEWLRLREPVAGSEASLTGGAALLDDQTGVLHRKDLDGGVGCRCAATALPPSGWNSETISRASKAR